MDILTELAIKYGTDKWGKHNYTPVYFDMFKDIKDSVKKVIEVGPAEGAGIKMFRDFFPNATIYGAEIDLNRVDKLQGLERIEVYQCDQNKPEDLADLLTITGFDIDIFIDDGSHRSRDQIITCLTILPLLKKDAIYIIEDVADDSIVRALDDFDYKLIRVGTRYDDQLLVLRNK